MDLASLLLFAPVLLFSMVAHEYAHGYAAYKQGDPTAATLGRLTWNPLPHIDPMMTVVLPLFTYYLGGFIFGGAKPVPVDPRNYRNYKRGDIIVSLAGVSANLVIALLSAVLILPLGALAAAAPGAAATCAILQHMAAESVRLNVFLAAFNLLPIPPLDGSHVFKYLLPPAWSLQYQQLGRFGFALLMLVLWVGRPLLLLWLTPAYTLIGGLLGAVGPLLPATWR